MKESCWVAISIALVGCSSHEAPSSKSADTTAPVTNVAPSTAPVPAPPHAAGLPPELASLAPNAVVEAGPFAWPPGGTSAIVADVPVAATKLVWHSPAGSGEVHLPRAAASAVVKDVTKDGAADLVIFAKPPAAAPQDFEDPSMTWLVGIDPTSKKAARMWLLEAAVIGVRDEAALERELATVGTFAATNDMSPIRIIARLQDATPTELQALVGSPGLKLCSRQGAKQSCKTIAQKSIDAKRSKQIVARGGVIAAFEPAIDGDPVEALQPPSCTPEEKNANRIDCTASVGGPAGGLWVFEKTPAGLRLAEVWSWAEDS